MTGAWVSLTIPVALRVLDFGSPGPEPRTQGAGRMASFRFIPRARPFRINEMRGFSRQLMDCFRVFIFLGPLASDPHSARSRPICEGCAISRPAPSPGGRRIPPPDFASSFSSLRLQEDSPGRGKGVECSRPTTGSITFLAHHSWLTQSRKKFPGNPKQAARAETQMTTDSWYSPKTRRSASEISPTVA